MAGWEELTADNLMTITWLVFIATIYCVTVMGIIRSFIHLKVSKNIKFAMEHQVAKQIAKDLKEPSLFVSIKQWLKKRKEKRQEDKSSKPIGVFE